MSGSPGSRSRLSRLAPTVGAAFLWLCGRLVPRHRRRRWIEEWRAELWHELRVSDRPARTASLLARTAGAARDAIDARRQASDRSVSSWRGLGGDLRFAYRTLCARPGYSLTLVAVLTLGIGAASTLFSVVDAVLLRPLQLPDSEQLMEVRVHGVSPDQGWEWSSSRIRADVLDAWREGVPDMESFAAINDSGFDTIFYLPGTDEPERLRGAFVSPGFFRLLGARPALGRVLSEADGEASACSTQPS